uniref:Phosphatidylinositol-4,5-bisphosphate 4-phosphatase n=1 Tax=Romanomermis culicivorax TaxID=13658 RepID=A0A915I1P3_ROMCU
MSERQPLLSPAETESTQIPSSEQVAESTDVPIAEKNGTTGGLTVNCRVCNEQINIEGKTAQHVVKCSNCNEATVIYCTYSSSSGRQKIRPMSVQLPINLQGFFEQNCLSAAKLVPMLKFNTMNNSLAHCPHCKISSSVGPSYAKKRFCLYFCLAVIVLAGGIGLAIGTNETASTTYPGLYALWAIFVLLSLLLFLRSFYFFRMKSIDV